MSVRRRSVIQSILIQTAFLFPALSFAADAPSAVPARPNIVFIMADDLGYGDVGCYGQRMIKTPNIDRLASEGIRFTDYYAGSTVCAPSRASLMTGQHQGHCFIRGNSSPSDHAGLQVALRPEDVTVAQVLKAAGYLTGAVGKWGLGEAGSTGVPNHKGFDHWFGYLNQVHAHDYYPAFLWNDEERFPLFPGQYTPDLIAQEATAFILRSAGKPFFLYLASTLPHANGEKGNEGMQIPNDAPYSAETWPQAQKNHAAMITRLDADIGHVLTLLHNLGLEQNTIVFFTSDNGPHQEGGADPKFFKSAGPLRGIKRDMYEGGIRVPMVVRWTGTIKPGQTSDHVWAHWDMLPTLATIVGATLPPGIDGLSMVPALTGGQAPRHEWLYWEFHERPSMTQAVRRGNWKAVRNGQGQALEIYDLSKDVGETRDLASTSPQIVVEMEEILKKTRTESALWPNLHAAAAPSPAPRRPAP